MRGANRWWLRLVFAMAAVALLLVAVVVFRPLVTQVVPDYGGSYVEAVAGRPKFVNPILAPPDSIDADLARLIFSGLTAVDERGEIVPDLATSWTISQDNLTYTFLLRDGVRWHDGAPFTSRDVVFTLRAMRDPDFQGTPEVAQLWRNIRVEAPDAQTVRVHLADGYSPILEFASVGILPAHLLEGVAATDLPSHSFNARPIGTGRFRLRGVTRDEMLLEVNDAFYGPKPYLNALLFRFYPDSDRAIAALGEQEVQGVRQVSVDDLTKLKSIKNVNTYATPDLSKMKLLLFNTRSPLLADKMTRQAIAYAIDRKALIDGALGGRGVRADGPVPPASWAYNSDAGSYSYQPDVARSLLQSAGWGADGEGWQRNGDRLKLVLLTNDNPERVQMSQQISRQLGKVGIPVEVNAVGWSGFVQDFLVPRKFQLSITEQWSPNFDPDGYPFWHSSQIAGGLNFASWANRRADELLENARRSADPQVRRPLYAEFQRIFADELPALPIAYPMYEFAADASLQGVQLGSLVTTGDRFNHIDQWYLRTKLVRR